jgi:hypothetical protein
VERKSGHSETGGAAGRASGGSANGGSANGGKTGASGGNASGTSGGRAPDGASGASGAAGASGALGDGGEGGSTPDENGGTPGAGGALEGSGGAGSNAAGGSLSGGAGGKLGSGGTASGGTAQGGSGSGGAARGGASSGGTGTGGAGKGGSGSGGAAMGGSSNCNLTKPFGTPTPLSTLNTNSDEGPPFVTADGLTVYMGRGDNNDVNAATRSNVVVSFPTPQKLNIVDPNAPVSVGGIAVTSNGLSMYYTQNWRFGTRIQLATRPSLTGAWTDLYEVQIPGVSYYFDPWLSKDEKRLYFANSTNETQAQIVMTTIGTGGFTDMVAVGGLAATEMSFGPVLTADELTIYFSSTRPGTGTKGDVDIWTATRSTATGTFQNLRPVSELNTAGYDRTGSLSPDGCVIYFIQRNDTTYADVFVAKKPL